MITLRDNTSSLEIGQYPDGESLVKFDYNNKPITIIWRYESDAEIMSLAQIYDIMKTRDPVGRMPKNLFIPYLPHAREDKETINRPQSLRILIGLLVHIVSHTNTHIYTLDVHSEIATNILNDAAMLYSFNGSIASIISAPNFSGKACRRNFSWENISSSKFAGLIGMPGYNHLSALDDIEEMTFSYDAVVRPDKGAHERCNAWANKVSKGVMIQCIKERNPDTGKLSDPKVLDIDILNNSKRVLVVDDIGTGFGTHIQLGKTLMTINPNIILDIFVSHSSFTNGIDQLLGLSGNDRIFHHIFTTDSLPKGSVLSNRIHSFPCDSLVPSFA